MGAIASQDTRLRANAETQAEGCEGNKVAAVETSLDSFVWAKNLTANFPKATQVDNVVDFDGERDVTLGELTEIFVEHFVILDELLFVT